MLNSDQSIYPCPFCFGELMGHGYIRNNRKPDIVLITCDTCNASGPVIDYIDDIGEAENEAIKRWNNLGNFRPTKKVPL